jgi:hypothetical protein
LFSDPGAAPGLGTTSADVPAVRIARSKGLTVKSAGLLTLFGFVFILAALPAAAQVNDTYVIAGAADAPGAFGTRWLTRFSVFNPHLDYPLAISITYLPTRGGIGIEEIIDVPPNSVAYSENLLRDLFGISGVGALLVATFPEDNPGVPNNVLSRSFLVTSDTYNDDPSGTYGQTVPGVWTGLMDIDSDGISSVAHGITNSPRLRLRTNVGAVNLGRCEIVLRVSAYNANGVRVLNQAPFWVPPLSHLQDSLPVQLEWGSVEFWVEDPCANDNQRYAVVFPFTSTIDELSGDPRFQSPTLLASPGILFSKEAQIDPASIGKKIDSDYARQVRENVERRSSGRLIQSENGWQISR